MADLLQLVDILIGDVLKGNIYNNTAPFKQFAFPSTPPEGQADASLYKQFARPSTPVEGQITSDYKGGNQYDNGSPRLVGKGGPYNAFPSVLGPVDIYAIAHWARNVGREVYFLPRTDIDPASGKSAGTTEETIRKSTTWLASQFLLTSLNRGDPQAYGIGNMVWNPLSFPLSLIPGLRSTPVTNITVGSVLGTYSDNFNATAGTERLLMMRNGLYSEMAPVERLNQLRSPVAKPGFIGDIAKDGRGGSDTLEQEKIFLVQGVPIVTQVDSDSIAAKLGLHTNLYNADRPYKSDGSTAIMSLDKIDTSSGARSPEHQKLSALFSSIPSANSDISKPTAWIAKPSTLRFGSEGMANRNDLPSITDASFKLQGEDPDSALVKDEPIKDSKIYLPFMFQDLRDPTDQFLYFRAFLKPGLSEIFTPEWQLERYYGRIDQVPTYMGTTRNLNVSFDVVAFSPADLSVMWTKLKKLQSMVYPTYDKDYFMQAGPIVKIRIGDLISDESGRGLPGYITSMDWSYDDGIWNIDTNLKVPRKISISLGFTVLHQGNPGIYIDPKTKKSVFGTLLNKDTTTISEGAIRKIFALVGTTNKTHGGSTGGTSGGTSH